MPTIVALTSGSPHSWIVVNAVAAEYGPITVLVERRPSRISLFLRRMKRHGIFWALGQAGFTLLQVIVARMSRLRVSQVLQENRLDDKPNPTCRVVPIDSVNSAQCRAALHEFQPEIVLVHGTQLIRAETLACLPRITLNFHSGINPKYRGQAGGYWALAQGDPEHAGATVHIVDKGVDTGPVVHQAPFRSGPRDNFSTYFYLQAAVLRDLALRTIDDILAGRLRTYTPDLPSRQFYHPTLWSYVWIGLTMGVW